MLASPFGDEYVELRRTVRASLATRTSGSVGDGRELGLVDVLAPESDGSALDAVAYAVVNEEFGRALEAAPAFPTASVLCVLLGSDEYDATEPALWSAIEEPGVAWLDGDLATEAIAGSDGHCEVSGVKSQVLATTETSPVVLTTANLDGAPAVVLVDVDRRTEVTAVPSIDPARPLVTVSFSRSPGRLVANGERGDTLVRAIDLARLGYAAESLGGLVRLLEISLEYAADRTQHGKALREFQAVSHQLVDMALDAECARGLVYRAALEAMHGSPAARSHAVAAAFVHGTEAYAHGAARAIQVQGAMGLMGENVLGGHYRRAWWTRSMLGGSEGQRRALASGAPRPLTVASVRT